MKSSTNGTSFLIESFVIQGSYYNLNQVLDLDDDTDFIDYNHLNLSGIEKTNKALIKEPLVLGYLQITLRDE